MNSKLLISISVLSMVAFGCSGESTTENSSRGSENHGARTYKLDPEARAIQISISGSRNPDADKFRFLMEKLRDSGELVNLVENEDDGSETMLCAGFADGANQGMVYELIRSIETSPKTTEFSANSVSGCSL